MRLIHSLRFKLTAIHLTTVVIPFLMLAAVSPFYFQRIVTRETQVLTEGTLNALARNIETYLDDLERLTVAPYLNDEIIRALRIKANNLYETADAYTKLKADRALDGTLPNFLINTREDILSTLIIPVEGPAYLATKYNFSVLIPNFSLRDQDWYKQAVKANGQAAFIGSHPQDYLSNRRETQVFSVARLIKDPDSGQPLAVMLADADTVVLEKITKDISFNVHSTIVILDESNKPIYSTRPLSDEILHQLGESSNTIKSEGEKYVVVSKTIWKSKWKIIVLLSGSELLAKLRWLYVASILFGLGGLSVTFLLFLYLTHWIIKPFKYMTDVMQRVKKGDLTARFRHSGQDEIAWLGRALNSMIAQLHDLIDREYKATLALRNAEYRALQSQIQPHFLYNILNGIIGLNRAGEREKLERLVFSLSGMLRYILEENEWTTVENEMRFLEQYGYLQKIRFQEKLDFQIDYDHRISNFRIPKLLLQPLLENAIIHGVEPCERPCTVRAKAVLRQLGSRSFLEFRIDDDGLGFTPHEQGNMPTGRVGLANVQARLSLAFPDATLSLRSAPGSGTRIRIRIPTEGRPTS